jgi:hypothetical protein
MLHSLPTEEEGKNHKSDTKVRRLLGGAFDTERNRGTNCNKM